MSIATALQDRIKKRGAGSVFCANDFLVLGNRGNTDVILHRLAKSGYIRKLGFGLYDKPISSPLLGDLTPDISAVMQAYRRRTGQIIVLDPLGAANALSLTNQVPAQMTFLTNGKSHAMQICGVNIKLVHASPKKLAGADTSVGIIVQALQYFGRAVIPNRVIKTIASQLSNKDIKTLKSLRTKTLQYITPNIDRILLNASTQNTVH